MVLWRVRKMQLSEVQILPTIPPSSLQAGATYASTAVAYLDHLGSCTQHQRGRGSRRRARCCRSSGVRRRSQRHCRGSAARRSRGSGTSRDTCRPSRRALGPLGSATLAWTSDHRRRCSRPASSWQHSSAASFATTQISAAKALASSTCEHQKQATPCFASSSECYAACTSSGLLARRPGWRRRSPRPELHSSCSLERGAQPQSQESRAVSRTWRMARPALDICHRGAHDSARKKAPTSQEECQTVRCKSGSQSKDPCAIRAHLPGQPLWAAWLSAQRRRCRLVSANMESCYCLGKSLAAWQHESGVSWMGPCSASLPDYCRTTRDVCERAPLGHELWLRCFPALQDWTVVLAAIGNASCTFGALRSRRALWFATHIRAERAVLAGRWQPSDSEPSPIVHAAGVVLAGRWQPSNSEPSSLLRAKTSVMRAATQPTCTQSYEQWRGQRVGEASHPGPANDPPAEPLLATPRRVRVKRPASSPPSAGRGSSAAAAEPDTPPLREEVQMEERQGADTQEQLLIHFEGRSDPVALKARWMPKSRNWRWQAGRPTDRMTKDSKLGKKAALAAWILAYKNRLQATSVDELNTAYALMEEDAVQPESQPRRPRRATSVADLSQPAACTLTIPDSAQCATMMAMDCAALLSAAIVSQRRIPKSSFAAVVGMLRRLWDIHEDPRYTSEQRRLAVWMILLAPRWCWPEPLHARGERLKPHTRPRLIKTRIAMLFSGQWSTLLTMTEGAAIMGQGDSPCQQLPPDTPGLITDSRLQHLQKMSQKGDLTKAWKQLWSHGTPGRTQQTGDMLVSKLLPPENVPMVSIKALPADPEKMAHFSDNHWTTTLQSFRDGKAQDALGWSQETWKACAEHEALRQAWPGMVRELLLSRHDPIAAALMVTSRLTGLFKDSTGKLRVISIPTCWRKARSHMVQPCLSGTNVQSAVIGALWLRVGPWDHADGYISANYH